MLISKSWKRILIELSSLEWDGFDLNNKLQIMEIDDDDQMLDDSLANY